MVHQRSHRERHGVAAGNYGPCGIVSRHPGWRAHHDVMNYSFATSTRPSSPWGHLNSAVCKLVPHFILHILDELFRYCQWLPSVNHIALAHQSPITGRFVKTKVRQSGGPGTGPEHVPGQVQVKPLRVTVFVLRVDLSILTVPRRAGR